MGGGVVGGGGEGAANDETTGTESGAGIGGVAESGVAGAGAGAGSGAGVGVCGVAGSGMAGAGIAPAGGDARKVLAGRLGPEGWVRGRTTRKVAPTPGVESTVASPPWASAMAATMDRPSPLPPPDRVRDGSAR